MSALIYRPTYQGYDFTPSCATSHEAASITDKLQDVIQACQNTETQEGHALRELSDTFLDCFQPNWDGYNALPVSATAFLQAKRFLSLTLRRFPAPTASALPGGSLSLEWIASPSRRLIVSLSGDAQVAYAGLFASDSVEGVATFINDVPMEISTHLARLFLK